MSSPPLQVTFNPRPLTLRERLPHYFRLVRLHRPIGILLLLWPCLWALWIAGDGHPPWRVVLIFALGVVLMRSAGCAINDYADRHFDGHVKRTCDRPLATGVIKPKEALWIFALLCLASFGLVLLLNWTTILMSFAALALAAVYPFMKRHTHLPQVVLGAAFGWAVPMSFTAIQGTVPLVGWLIFAAAVIWAVIYDTEYAMVDREDDLRIGVKSTAILFGRHDRLIIGILQAVMLAILLWVGWMAGLGLWYNLGLAVAAGLFVHQQYQIRNREPALCFKAFLDNNTLGMLIFVGLLADYLAR